MGTRARALGVLLAVAAAAALTIPATVSASAVDWATYGFSVNRGGYNPFETQITIGNVHKLKQKWARHVGFLIDTQPIVAGNVLIKGKRSDIVYAGSEDGRFAAINANTGRVIWRKSLGRVTSSCTDLPTYGITGAAQLQRSRNSIYVSTRGRLYDLNLTTGKTKRRWTLTSDPHHEHNWSALTLSRGRIYAAFAGICDTLPYQGKIVSVNTRTGKRSATWNVTGSGGGIWSYGGLSADSAGNIFTATGDSNQVAGGHAGYSERVVKLSYNLKVRSSNFPHVPGRDADFGATPLLYRAPGCPPQLAVGNKYGSFFVYDRQRIGRGPVQRIGLGGSIRGQKALLGVGAYSPQTNMVYTMNPRHRGNYKPGIVAFRVTKKCRLKKAWNAAGPGKLQSSPTIANGVLYYATGGRGDVVAFNASTGRRLARFHIGAPIFAAPTVVNGRLYVSAWDGHVYKYALP